MENQSSTGAGTDPAELTRRKDDLQAGNHVGIESVLLGQTPWPWIMTLAAIVVVAGSPDAEPQTRIISIQMGVKRPVDVPPSTTAYRRFR